MNKNARKFILLGASLLFYINDKVFDLEYLFILLVIGGLVWLGLADRMKYNRLKRNGIKVTGVIIANKEHRSSDNDVYRLGGNINKPTVKFVTKDGRDITGAPVLGFVTQHEVVPPLRVTVFYDSKQPERFCIDFDCG